MKPSGESSSQFDQASRAHTCSRCGLKNGQHTPECPLSSKHFADVMKRVDAPAPPDPKLEQQEKVVKNAKDLLEQSRTELSEVIAEEAALASAVGEKKTDRLTQWVDVMNRVTTEIAEVDRVKYEPETRAYHEQQIRLLGLTKFQKHLLQALGDGVVTPEEESVLQMEGLRLEKDGTDLLHTQARLEAIRIRRSKLEMIVATLTPIVEEHNRSTSEIMRTSQPLSEAEKAQSQRELNLEMEGLQMDYTEIRDAKEFRRERIEKLHEIRGHLKSLNAIGLKILELNFTSPSPDIRAEATVVWSELKKQKEELLQKIHVLREELKRTPPSFQEMKERLQTAHGAKFSDTESRDLFLLDVEQAVAKGDYAALALDQTWYLNLTKTKGIFKKEHPRNITEDEAQQILSAILSKDISVDVLSNDPLKTFFATFVEKPWYKELTSIALQSQFVNSEIEFLSPFTHSDIIQTFKKAKGQTNAFEPEKGLASLAVVGGINVGRGVRIENSILSEKEYVQLIFVGFAEMLVRKYLQITELESQLKQLFSTETEVSDKEGLKKQITVQLQEAFLQACIQKDFQRVSLLKAQSFVELSYPSFVTEAEIKQADQDAKELTRIHVLFGDKKYKEVVQLIQNKFPTEISEHLRALSDRAKLELEKQEKEERNQMDERDLEMLRQSRGEIRLITHMHIKYPAGIPEHLQRIYRDNIGKAEDSAMSILNIAVETLRGKRSELPVLQESAIKELLSVFESEKGKAFAKQIQEQLDEIRQKKEQEAAEKAQADAVEREARLAEGRERSTPEGRKAWELKQWEVRFSMKDYIKIILELKRQYASGVPEHLQPFFEKTLPLAEHDAIALLSAESQRIPNGKRLLSDGEVRMFLSLLRSDEGKKVAEQIQEQLSEGWLKQIHSAKDLSILDGLDTVAAWNVRKSYLSTSLDMVIAKLLPSIAGMDSQTANNYRRKLWKRGVGAKLILDQIKDMTSESAARLRAEIEGSGEKHDTIQPSL